jgi:hypothetical protein
MMPAWWRPLSAEWLRLSRRWDVWLVGALVLGAGGWLYISAFRDGTGIMGSGDQGSWGPGEGPPPEPWFLDAMLGLRQPFAFPGSLLTILDSAWVLVPLGAYIATVTIGPDFWWGTMRSILVTRRSRVAYLAHRLAMIALLVAGVLLAILAFASVAQVAMLAFAGERFPDGSLDVDAFTGMLVTRFAAAFGYALIAAALTLIARSLAGGIVLLAAFVAGELAVGAAATSLGMPLVRELTFSGAISSIVEQLRPVPLELIVDYEIGALVPAAQQPTPPVHLLSVEMSALAVVVWLAVWTGFAFVRMRSMDIAD